MNHHLAAALADARSAELRHQSERPCARTRWRPRTLAAALLAVLAMNSAATAQAQTGGIDAARSASATAAAGEYARHGVPAESFQRVFDDAVKLGYRLVWIDGYSDSGRPRLNAIFHPNPAGVTWRAHWGMTGAQYQARFDEYVGQGYRLVQIESYLVDGAVRYAAIFVKVAGPPFVAYHGLSATQHQQRFDQLKKQGYVPAVISVVSINGQRVYAALYVKTSVGAWEARSFLTASEYQKAFDRNHDAARRLVYLNSYTHQGAPRFTAIWWAQPPASIRARHGLTSSDYQTHWETNTSEDWRTQAVTGYETTAGVRFAAFWAK